MTETQEAPAESPEETEEEAAPTVHPHVKNSFDITGTEPFVGIYLLCNKKNEVSYVGRSTDALMRKTVHKRNKDMPFERVYFFRCDWNKLQMFESAFIHQFQPPKNARSKNKQYLGVLPWNEILRDMIAPFVVGLPLKKVKKDERT